MEADLGLAATIFLVALDRTIDNAASSLIILCYGSQGFTLYMSGKIHDGGSSGWIAKCRVLSWHLGRSMWF